MTATKFPFFDRKAHILDGLDDRLALLKAFGRTFHTNGNLAVDEFVTTKGLLKNAWLLLLLTHCSTNGSRAFSPSRTVTLSGDFRGSL